MVKSIVAFICLLLFSNLIRADDKSELIKKADALYDKGDCTNAINEYRSLLSTKSIDEEVKNEIEFRIAYCQLDLEKYEEAEKGFRNYLKKFPHEEEGKVKYSQSLLYQSKNDEALRVAREIKSPDYIVEAAIVIARADIELGNPLDSVTALKPFTESAKKAEVTYWLGVAHYESDQDDAAEKDFKYALNFSSKDSWIKNDSQNWLDSIEEQKRKFHIQLTLGGIDDSNIAQSGSQVSVNRQGSGGSGSKSSQAAATSANYIADRGLWADLDLIYNIYASRKLYLTSTLSASSPFYFSNAPYNSESGSLDLNLTYVPNSKLSYGTSLKYLNTWYAYVYSQDYIILSPFFSWKLVPKGGVKFSIPLTSYLNNKSIYLFAPALDLHYQLNSWITLSGGGSWTRSTAPSATIDNGRPPALLTGTLFAHYVTTSAYLGLALNLPWSFDLNLSRSTAWTDYDLENVPPSNSGRFPPPRNDVLYTTYGSLSRMLIKNFWSAALSYTYTDNQSSGFPGLPSSGSVANNNYTRSYTLLSTTLYY